ncbi:MAG TPA: hypothetical protein VK338_00485 [Candidatus Nitrosocosmicus sp.]|nr:hypothetical protein [Candidatus Nitrosocosmicus sp.]
MSNTELHSGGWTQKQEEALQETIKRGLEDGTIVPIMMGDTIVCYHEVNPEDPEQSVEPYQKLKGHIGCAKLIIEKSTDPLVIEKYNKTIREAEQALDQLRSIVPQIDQLHADYEKRMDELQKSW